MNHVTGNHQKYTPFNMIKNTLATFVFFLFLLTACAALQTHPEARPIPAKDDRLLGINVNMAQDQNFDMAFNTAKDAGMKVISLKLDWDDVEKKPGVYSSPFPAIADQYYSIHNIKLSLRMATLDTNQNRIPEDLRDKPHDHPSVIRRFNQMVNWLASQMPTVELVDFSIGNEADASLGTDPKRWKAFIAFFKATKAHAKKVWPETLIGSSLTSGGHMGTAKTYVQELNRHADVVMISYYPLNEDFTFKDPSVIKTHFKAFCHQYPKRPIYLSECGYPSGKACGSSLEQQKRFIQNVFAAWDAHANQIGQIMFVWMHDRSPATVKSYQHYYGIAGPAFADFMATLGLRTFQGKDKPAWNKLRAEAKRRGWAQ